MSNDIFICGDCQTIFDDLSQFVTHKKDGCQGVRTQVQEVTGGQEGESSVSSQIYIIQTPSMDTEACSMEEDGMNAEHPVTEYEVHDEREEGEVDPMEVQVKGDEEEMLEAKQEEEAEGEVIPSQHVELVPVESGNSSGLQIIVKQRKLEPVTRTGKKRGRPRKVVKEATKEEIIPTPPQKPPPPERGVDGMYHCAECKKAYRKERHLLTHKCMGSGDYLDIMNKDAVAAHSDIDDDDGDDEYEYVQEEDYRVQPRGRGRGRGRPRGRPRGGFTPRGVVYMRAKKAEIMPDEEQTEESEMNIQPEAPSVLIEESADPDKDQLPPTPKKSRVRHELPIFLTEEDKMAFEESLSVDFENEVAHLYSVHVIEQNVNENAPQATTRSSNFLNVFSCNVCSKVFMALSQVKTHCLSHTDLRPYKCIKCDYATNCKGNLYTHMRKHTGQLYKCDQCEFRSANRTHLVEHEATHRPEKHACVLCRKEYNTFKSMLNHVRKYHDNSKEGRTLLESLQGKQKKAPAMLHQCHVCNRKFKKKIDRDRHLFVHNIRDSDGGVYVCKLCNHASVRREYFLKHVARHRIIYRCSLCLTEFPSCQKLNDHLLSAHEECSSDQANLQSAFEESIKSSVFLPEPDGSLDGWLEGTVKVESEPKEDEESAEPAELADSLILKQQGPLPLLSEDSTVSTESTLAFEGFSELGYKSMTLEIFSKLRETFGQEECEFCGRLFFYKNDYSTHIRTHTGDKPFKCNECDFRSNNKETLRQHIERDHRNVCYMCNECTRPFRTMRTLLAHQQLKHPEATPPGEAPPTSDGGQQVTCTMCDLTFDSIKRMKVHLQIKHSDISAEEVRQLLAPFSRQQGKIGRKTYKCPYCDKMFCRGSAELQKHLWVHEGVKPYKCTECPHACRSKSNLSAHMITHSAEKPFLCTHCGKEYKSRTALRWHVRSHKFGKLFKCDKCPYEATQGSHLKRHMETHNVVKRYACSLCDYSSNTIGYMKIHYTRHHKGQQYDTGETSTKPMASETKVFRCLSCDYMFGNLSDMKRHLRVRHHLASEDMRSLEVLEEGVTVLQSEADASNTQVLQLPEGGEHTVTTTLDPMQYQGQVEEGIGDMTTLQVVDVQQDPPTEEAMDEVMTTSEVTSDGYMAVNPEAIIIQHEQEVVLTQDGMENQYVIQYVLSEDANDPGGTQPLTMVAEGAPNHDLITVADSNYIPSVSEVKETMATQEVDMATEPTLLKIEEVKTEEAKADDVIQF